MKIKFRGFLKTTDRWIYGSSDFKKRNYVDDLYTLERFFHFKYGNYLIENSLGQFIGLKDKHGKEIYVGDIIKIKSKSLNLTATGMIYFCDEASAFLIDDPEGKQYIPLTIHDDIEILSNIIENPELYKGEL